MSLTFAEAVAKQLNNQEVEIYLGDMGMIRVYSQHQEPMKEVIRGSVVGASGDMLILEINRDGLKTKVYLNGWNIKTVIRVNTEFSTIDMYNSEADRIKK